jgi:hypothetical protein
MVCMVFECMAYLGESEVTKYVLTIALCDPRIFGGKLIHLSGLLEPYAVVFQTSQ